MSSAGIFFLVTCVLQSAHSVPIQTPEDNEITVKKNDSYDITQFDEVYDQRQNGTENYRVNVNKVVLVWTPPGSLLATALLLDPALYEPEGESIDFFGLAEEKPEDSNVIKPETTNAPQTISTNKQSANEPTTSTNGNKRKLRLPGFIRPFVRRTSLD